MHDCVGVKRFRQRKKQQRLEIYKAFDLYGNQKRPLTTEEQVLIFAIGKAIQEGRIVSVIRRDK